MFDGVEMRKRVRPQAEMGVVGLVGGGGGVGNACMRFPELFTYYLNAVFPFTDRGVLLSNSLHNYNWLGEDETLGGRCFHGV